MTLSANNPMLTRILAVLFFLVSVFFVHKSFYGMRIELKAGNPVVEKEEDVVLK